VSGVLAAVSTVTGGLMVLVALRDILHTIFHPSGRSGLSRHLMSGVWRLSRRGRRERWLGHVSGPMAMGLVALAWLVLLQVGFALVYVPHLPEGFVYGSGLGPEDRAGFFDAMYLSAVMLGTLGLGDIVPVTAFLRIVVPAQALVGFALISAAVSWVLQVYPALTRRRSLAVRLAQLRRAPTLELVRSSPSPVATTLLLEVADRLAGLRADLTQYAETYYFRDHDDEASLPAMVGVALDMAEEAVRSPDVDVRYAGRLLQIALEDYLGVVDDHFLDLHGPLREISAAYAADHGRRLATAW
jgi:hypothetical protein